MYNYDYCEEYDSKNLYFSLDPLKDLTQLIDDGYKQRCKIFSTKETGKLIAIIARKNVWKEGISYVSALGRLKCVRGGFIFEFMKNNLVPGVYSLELPVLQIGESVTVELLWDNEELSRHQKKFKEMQEKIEETEEADLKATILHDRYERRWKTIKYLSSTGVLIFLLYYLFL